MGRTYYALGNYEKAEQYFESAVERNEAIYLPRLYLAATYVHLDRKDGAEWQVTELEILTADSKISHWQRVGVITDRDLRKRLFDDLRAAGMAE